MPTGAGGAGAGSTDTVMAGDNCNGAPGAAGVDGADTGAGGAGGGGNNVCEGVGAWELPTCVGAFAAGANGASGAGGVGGGIVS